MKFGHACNLVINKVLSLKLQVYRFYFKFLVTALRTKNLYHGLNENEEKIVELNF